MSKARDLICIIIISFVIYLNILFEAKAKVEAEDLKLINREIFGIEIWSDDVTELHTTSFIFWLSWLFGRRKILYLIFNVFINSLTTICFYLLCDWTIGSTCFYSILIFLLHPIHSQLVNDVRSTSQLISLLLAMSSLLLRHQIVTNQKLKMKICYIIICCVFTSLSGDLGFNLLLATSSIDIFSSSIFSNIILIASACACRFYVITPNEASVCDVIIQDQLPLSSYLLGWISSFRLFLFPISLPYRVLTVTSSGCYVTAAFVMIWLLLISCRRQLPWKPLAYSFIFSFVPVAVSMTTTKREEVSMMSLYFASAGFAIFMMQIFPIKDDVITNSSLHTRLKSLMTSSLRGVFFLVLAISLFLSVTNSIKWKDEDDVIRSAYKSLRGDSRMNYVMGTMLLKREKFRKSVQFIEKSFRLDRSRGRYLATAADILTNYIESHDNQTKVSRFYLEAISDRPKCSHITNRLIFFQIQNRIPYKGSLDRILASDDVTMLMALLEDVRRWSRDTNQHQQFQQLLERCIEALCSDDVTDARRVDWKRCWREQTSLVDMYQKLADLETKQLIEIAQHDVNDDVIIQNCSDLVLKISNDDVTEDQIELLVSRCLRHNRMIDESIEAASQLSDAGLRDVIFREIFHLRPNHREIKFQQARLLRDQGARKEALQMMRKLISEDLKCERFDWLKFVAKELDRNGRIVETIAVYKKCLKGLRRRHKRDSILPEGVGNDLKVMTSQVRFEIASRLRAVSHMLYKSQQKSKSRTRWKESLLHLRAAVDLNPDFKEAKQIYEKLSTADFDDVMDS